MSADPSWLPVRWFLDYSLPLSLWSAPRLLTSSPFCPEMHMSGEQLFGRRMNQNVMISICLRLASPISRKWPSPISRKELQRFLGFANFYRRFIRYYSSVATPLTALTSNTSPFAWTSKAEATFLDLKTHFSSAPVLTLPDTGKQFVVEVDTSDTGVGALLSQRAPDNKMHPCAFFSRRLSPMEWNDCIGMEPIIPSCFLLCVSSLIVSVIYTLVCHFRFTRSLCFCHTFQRLPA